MNDDQFELVSAYLDGAVTDEERARVESDEELLAAVRELRAISIEVSDAPPASPAVKEAAIAAALAEFDAGAPTERMPATPPPAVPPPPQLAGVDESSVDTGEAAVVPLAPRRRFRLGHAVSVAAAAVVVVVGGLAVLRDDADAPTLDDAASRETIAGLPGAADAPSTSRAAVVLTTSTAPPDAGGQAPAATTAVTGPPVVFEAAPPTDDAAGADAARDDARDEPAGDAAADPADEAAAPDPPAAAPATTAAGPGATPTTPTAPPATPTTIGMAAVPPPPDAAIEPSSELDAGATMAATGVPETEPETATGRDDDEPTRLTTREEFADYVGDLEAATDATSSTATTASVAPGAAAYADALAPLPIDEATERCTDPDAEPLEAQAVYVDDDGVEHPIALVLIPDADGTPVADDHDAVHGGLDVVTCTLVVDTAEPTLVATTSPPSSGG